MYTIKQLDAFSDWLNGLREHNTRLRLARRLEKASRGLLGDVKFIGEGVYEMREHFGAGWRMYYTQRGDAVIVMLGGGDKSSQSEDIKVALQRVKLLRD
jgi:putative addiction module killer protein